MILYYLLVAVSPFFTVPVLSHLTGDPFKWLGAACAVYAGFHLIRGHRGWPGFRTPQVRLFLVFYAVAAISYLSQPGGLGRSGPLLIYTSMAIFLFTTIALVDSVLVLRHVLVAAVISIAIGSFYLVREWRITHGRAGMSVGDGNYFSTAAALYLPFGFLIVLHSKRRREKVLFTCALLAGLVGVALSGSRGGFLALAVTLLVISLHLRQRVRILAVAALVLIPVMLLLPNSPLRRLRDPSRTDQENVARRAKAWRAGVRMIAAQPFTGVGLGNFKRRMPAYAQSQSGVNPDFASMAHNTYIEIAAELGLPALLVYLGVIASSVWSLDSVRRQTARHPTSDLHLAAIALKSGLLGYAVGAAFLSTEYQKPFWLVVFLSVCVRAIHRRQLRRARPAPLKVAEPEADSAVAAVATGGDR